MRLSPLFAAAAILIATAAMPAGAGEAPPAGINARTGQLDAVSAAKRKKRPRAYQAYGRSGTQIACTQFGCNPIPRGCRIRTGFNPFTWDPSGFDEVVCPYR